MGRLRPVAMWRQAFGKVWNDALVDWLATHLPGSIVLPEGSDPGAGDDPSDALGPSPTETRCEEKGS